MKKISSFEYGSLMWFVIRASFVGITLANIISISKVDAWFSAIMALVLGLLPFIIFELIRKCSNKNIFEINSSVFGKFGKFMNIILIVGSYIFALVVFADLTYFISSQFLYKTSLIFISAFFIVPLIYALINGENAFSKTSLILFYITFFTVLFIDISLSTGVSIDNIRPIMSGDNDIFKGAIIMIAYNVLPLCLLLAISKKNINGYSFKKSLWFYVLSMITVVMVVFCTISVYGINLSMLLEFPEFHLLKKVSIGNFINKLEGILSMEWVVALFFLLLITIYFIVTGIRNLFPIKKSTNNYSIIIICASLLIINTYTFMYNGSSNDFVTREMLKIMYVVYFILPCITLIGLLFKIIQQQNYTGSNNYDH